MSTYSLYRFDDSLPKIELSPAQTNYSIFRPSLHELLLTWKSKDGFQPKPNPLVVELYWGLNTMFKYLIYCATIEGKVLHTSYVTKYCLKFKNFMNKNDIQIGPCYTDEAFRGRGIYTNIIRKIIEDNYDGSNNVYMIARDENLSSVNVIVKSGFIRIGEIRKTKYLHRFVLTK